MVYFVDNISIPAAPSIENSCERHCYIVKTTFFFFFSSVRWLETSKSLAVSTYYIGHLRNNIILYNDICKCLFYVGGDECDKDRNQVGHQSSRIRVIRFDQSAYDVTKYYVARRSSLCHGRGTLLYAIRAETSS